MSLGITVDFNANMVEFSRQLDKANAQMEKFRETAKASTAQVASMWTAFQSKQDIFSARRNAEALQFAESITAISQNSVKAEAATGLLSRSMQSFSGIAAGLSTAALVGFVKSGIDAADAMNDLADRSGIAVEKLAGLQFAVKLGDTNMESFIGASNKLSINMAKNAVDFEKLGITAKDPVEAFKQLSDTFSSIEDPQQRAAFGAAALGKSYAEMAPLLMMGADGIQELIDKGREHNPITAEQARLAGEFNDNLEELSATMENLSIRASGPAVRAINEFTSSISFANQVIDGFHPFRWLEAQVVTENAGKLEYLKDKISEYQDQLKEMETQGLGGQFVDLLLGNNYEDTYANLQNLIAERDKLLNPGGKSPDKSNTTKPSDNAITSFIQKTGDETDESGKKFDKASQHVKAYRTEVDLLTKSLTDAAAKLAVQRPDNLLQLENITATPEQQAELRRKALTQKNIEFDKANKTGNLADAARIAQEREQLAFENAKEDLYGVKAGELPSYKAYDAKQNYNKAVEASKKAFDRFQATGQIGTTDQPVDAATDGKLQTTGKPGTVDGKTDVATQISQFEQLAKLIDRVEKPIKIDVSSNVAEQIAQIDQLQQRLAAVDSSVTNTTASGGSNANNTEQSLSTEVLKRGSRT